MEQENINALDEIHKGAYMGMDAINFILDKVQSKELAKVLHKQHNQYKDIAKRIEKIYSKYDNGEPHKTNTMTKAMTWYEIGMKTFADKSDSHIAELLLNGVNIGIIEGRKILNKKDINKEVNKIVSIYVTMQEECVEILKKYL